MTDPNPGPIRKVVIVGGGTAGWMVAAAAARYLDDGQRQIVLIESDAIGTVGVGEATIPPILGFNALIGVDERDFLRATGATFKLGIEFVGWDTGQDRYMHAFGGHGRDIQGLAFHQLWLKLRNRPGIGGLDAYAPSAVAAYLHKFGLPNGQQPLAYAYHFDAGLYAAFLRRRAEAGGVTRIEGRITGTDRHPDTGHVSAVRLDDGRSIDGDLFIDCSGFRSLLLGETMGVPFEDWSHWLPCDRAVAVPTEPSTPLLPYTRATARTAGWQWRIPLQHRTGNGHVYSSDHISDDEATATLLANLDSRPTAEPRQLRFKAGRREKLWDGNVVALGLAGGFLEPLESTSIHLIQSAISRLLKLLPGRVIADADRTEFNRQSDFEYERIRDFIILHYKATERDDTPFWRQCRDMAVPDTLAAKIDLWRGNGHIVREHEELFTEVGWLQVLAGQGIIPAGHHPLADAISTSDLGEFMDTIDKLNAREVAQMQHHAAFVAQHCAAPAGLGA